MSKSNGTPWQNRIVGHGEEAPDQLLANPGNWRIHPQFQQDALAGVLSEVGLVQNVIVNQRTGHLVDGHLRVSLALRTKQPTIPVVYVDLDEAEEALVLATLDPLSALAATDAEKLEALLHDVQTGEEAVQEMLAGLAKSAGLFPDGTVVDDPFGEWRGMPEFEQDSAFGAVHSLKVHFATFEDIQAFAAAVGQTVTDSTKFIWYPKQEPENLKKYVARDES